MRALFPGFLFCLLLPATAWAQPPRHVTAANAPRALSGEGAVQVRWNDPARFSEITHSGNRWEAARGNWVFDLASHLATQAAPRLAQGQRLDVTITDIDLAGDYEPWRGPQLSDTRFVRDIYPPQITLEYRLLGSGDQVLSSARENLRDLGFLHGTGSRSRYRNDALRHEKQLLDRWIQQLLPGTSAGPVRR